MNEEQRRKYLNNPRNCWSCGSFEIVGGELKTEPYLLKQKIECGACGEQWWDEYKITNITPIEDEDGDIHGGVQGS